MTMTFHLTQPDGTFLDYIAMPFAFVLPGGDARQGRLDDPAVAGADRAVRDHRLRAAPAGRLIRRNPSFQSWTPDTPDGHLDGSTCRSA